MSKMNTFALEMANLALFYFSLREVTAGNAAIAIFTSDGCQSIFFIAAVDSLTKTILDGSSTA